MKLNKSLGFAIIPVILIGTTLIGVVIFVFSGKLSLEKPYLTKNTNTPEFVNTPTPTVLETPTPTPTAIPTASPTPSVTFIPTVKPVSIHPPYTGALGSGYSKISVTTEKGVFSAHVLSVDLSGAKIITDTANDGECGNGCSVLSLASFVTRNGGYAGVNGTYFCPATYPECSSKTNSFDFPVYNTRLGRWINGGNLFWNSRAIVYFDGSGAHYLQNASGFGGGLSAGVVNYPGLVDNGNVQIDDNQSGLSDKQKAKGTKVGIGVKNTSNVIVVIALNVNMQEFSYVFKALGVTGALNLDTGGSTALYYNGKYILGPGREIPNAIIFAPK